MRFQPRVEDFLGFFGFSSSLRVTATSEKEVNVEQPSLFANLDSVGSFNVTPERKINSGSESCQGTETFYRKLLKYESCLCSPLFRH
jgi:hypothetical protein